MGGASALTTFPDSLAEPGILGACSSADAFISHSFQDDSLAKWRSLERWGTDFAEQHGRAPLFWIDTCCGQGVKPWCLPIFLGGCKRLVVLCGPSYPSSLRCLLEMCLYVHVGGSVSNIDLIFISEEGSDVDDTANAHTFEMAFAEVDSEDNVCFEHAEREGLAELISLAFGSESALRSSAKNLFEK